MKDFLFPWKLSRWPFLWRAIGFDVAAAMLIGEGASHGFSLRTIAMLAALYGYGFFFLFLPRIRDGAISRWLLLLLLVPYGGRALSVLLLLKPSIVRWRHTDDSAETPDGPVARAGPGGASPGLEPSQNLSQIP